MTAPLAPQYDPSEIESQLYAWWRERDLFSPEGAARARGGPPGEPYVIQMPPPNAGHPYTPMTLPSWVAFEP